jgi:hypothetical protein
MTNTVKLINPYIIELLLEGVVDLLKGAAGDRKVLADVVSHLMLRLQANDFPEGDPLTAFQKYEQHLVKARKGVEKKFELVAPSVVPELSHSDIFEYMSGQRAKYIRQSLADLFQKCYWHNRYIQ